MSLFSFLTSLLFIILIGFFVGKNIKHTDNFIRTYSKYSLSHIFALSLFFLALISVILANLGIINFGFYSSSLIQGGDIIFTLDVSKSMDAQDIKDASGNVSRLETAKKWMIDYISKHPENRYGITIFAGKSLISSPLTTDIDVLTNIISSLDSKSIREGGTNLEDALNLATHRFSKTESGKTENKTILLLTDGGETDDITSWENIKAIIQKNTNINYTIIGLGTRDGAMIPMGTDVFGNTIYKTFDGREVTTKLGTDNLDMLGNITDSKPIYLDSTASFDIFSQAIDSSIRKNTQRVLQSQNNDSSRILLFASSIFLLASMLVIKIKK